MSLDEILADFSVARDYPMLAYEEAKNTAKRTIYKDLMELIEQSQIGEEWNINGNVAIHKIGFIDEQELREKVKEYCE